MLSCKCKIYILYVAQWADTVWIKKRWKEVTCWLLWNWNRLPDFIFCLVAFFHSENLSTTAHLHSLLPPLTLSIFSFHCLVHGCPSVQIQYHIQTQCQLCAALSVLCSATQPVQKSSYTHRQHQSMLSGASYSQNTPHPYPTNCRAFSHSSQYTLSEISYKNASLFTGNKSLGVFMHNNIYTVQSTGSILNFLLFWLFFCKFKSEKSEIIVSKRLFKKKRPCSATLKKKLIIWGVCGLLRTH